MKAFKQPSKVTASLPPVSGCFMGRFRVFHSQWVQREGGKGCGDLALLDQETAAQIQHFISVDVVCAALPVLCLSKGTLLGITQRDDLSHKQSSRPHNNQSSSQFNYNREFSAAAAMLRMSVAKAWVKEKVHEL